MSEQEQRLAEYLKRAVPEPLTGLSPEELTVPHPERSRKSWAMPVLAAAAVVAIGVTIGAVATHHSTTRPPAASSVADQGSTGPASTASASTASAQPTPSCQVQGQGQGARAVVPSVVGMNFRQAVHVLTQAGFESVTVMQPSTEPVGSVIKQYPAAGTQLRRGALIEMTASEAKALGTRGTSLLPNCVPSATPSAIPSGSTVAVPSVIGMTQLQAEQILQAAGFTVILHAETRAGQSVPAGEVWSQSVPAGAKAPSGTTITLDVVPN
jgi:hypothetical protein